MIRLCGSRSADVAKSSALPVGFAPLELRIHQMKGTKGGRAEGGRGSTGNLLRCPRGELSAGSGSGRTAVNTRHVSHRGTRGPLSATVFEAW